MFKKTQNLPVDGASTAAPSVTPSQDVIEARQESQIWTAYALSPYLRASDLKVSVHEGTATLTGHVAEDSNKELAKQIALGVDGIKYVENRIDIHPLFLPPVQAAERASTVEAREGAAKVARNTQDVASVDNQLVVPVDDPGVVTSIGTDIADGWITAKVQSSFMYSARVSTSDIVVNTQAGIVTLTGRVGSEAERNLAVNLASDVRGVTSVDSSSLTI
jgi:hyperosmotically inducible protein